MSIPTKDWNPEGYLKFKQERTQPSVDLVNRIEHSNPIRIIDVGCGPGNSTEILLKRWPRASVFGIDSSPKMIEKAKADYPEQRWILGDASTFIAEEKFDIIFTNATIQWIPNHHHFLPHLLNQLAESGVMAIQMPLYHEMKISVLINEIYESKYRKESSFNINFSKEFHSTPFYYEILKPLVSDLNLWETYYLHDMESHRAILEMIKTSGMRPYLSQIESEADQQQFEADILMGLPSIYPAQSDGRVLFPFKRMFLLAYK